MFKLIKFIFSSIVFAGFMYFMFFVPLGNKTLYEHIHKISQTRAAKDLGNGIAKTAEDVTLEMVDHVPGVPSGGSDVSGDTSLMEKTEKKSAAHNKKGYPANKSGQLSEKSRDSHARVSYSKKHTETVSTDDKQALSRLLKSKLNEK